MYILYSSQIDRFYKGQTRDIVERIDRHNNRREKATSDGVPWTLVWNTQKETRSEAVILEKKLKNLSRTRLIRFMLKYRESVVGPDELLLLQQLSGC